MIQVDVPNPLIEPDLHHLVITFQKYHCNHRCRTYDSTDKQYSKGFPQPLSERTYCSSNNLRYVYCRTKQEDQIIIPYHPETLLIWRGHINFQYITTNGFVKYITKYVTKSEPSELFDISEEDSYKKHITARRLGTMELIILLLQYPLMRCSILVLYLPSVPSEFRYRFVKPIYLLTEIGDDNNDNKLPYWDDAIDKYFDCSDHPNFHLITYPNYFHDYTIRFK
ncbi:hypothetical protein Glove_543g106 [Diversispora epigaea]|uniref:Uncharacterized protein n=1 Tax=Diversispora epigaea TaxID=1348612 RepID=A0A397GFU1_9GLOM|nr:hypothetical protein Glove_543g106 [Diversispora epigaea]